MREIAFAALITTLLLIPCRAAEERRSKPIAVMTDLVPQSAVGALLFRNVNEFKQRGDKVAARIGFPGSVSMLGRLVGSTLKLSELIDDDRPCGVIWFERKLINGGRNGRHPMAVGVAVRPEELDDVAERLETDRESLERGDIKKSKGELGYEHRYVRLHGDYVWIGSSPDLFDIVLEKASLTEMIPLSRRADILKSDILLAGNARSAEVDRPSFVRQTNEWVDDHLDLDPEEREAVKEVVSVFQGVTWAMVSIRVEEGLAGDLDIFFDPKYHDAIETVLKRFNPKGIPSTLRGLPDEDVLLAHAAHVEGGSSLPAMAVLGRSMGNVSPRWARFDQKEFLTEIQQLELLGLFGEVWGHIHAYRTAVYRNREPDRHGLTSLVAVLDTDDAGKLIGEMRELAGIMDGTGLPLPGPGEPTPPATEEVIRGLVSKLGDRSYRLRQSATTRLTLIGEPALKHVEAVENSPSLEVRRRARRIIERIRVKVKQLREEALKPGLIREAKPTLIFHESAEKRLGHDVHVIELHTAPGSRFERQFHTMFGRGWRQIRLVPDQGRLVLLVGSDVSLLDRTLKNIDNDAPGLAASKREHVATDPLHGQRGAEFLIGVSRFLNLATTDSADRVDAPSDDEEGEAEPKKPVQVEETELSGLGMTLQREFILFQWRISIQDLKNARRWWW